MHILNFPPFLQEAIKENKNISRNVQLTASSRRENGGAYGGDVFEGKWVVSKGKIFQITCSVSWYGRFWSTTNFGGSRGGKEDGPGAG